MAIGSWELAPALVERLKAEYESLKGKGEWRAAKFVCDSAWCCCIRSDAESFIVSCLNAENISLDDWVERRLRVAKLKGELKPTGAQRSAEITE